VEGHEFWSAAYRKASFDLDISMYHDLIEDGISSSSKQLKGSQGLLASAMD
jgi:hypothetical protein